MTVLIIGMELHISHLIDKWSTMCSTCHMQEFHVSDAHSYTNINNRVKCRTTVAPVAPQSLKLWFPRLFRSSPPLISTCASVMHSLIKDATKNCHEMNNQWSCRNVNRFTFDSIGGSHLWRVDNASTCSRVTSCRDRINNKWVMCL